jgi:hypothetical protein
MYLVYNIDKIYIIFSINIKSQFLLIFKNEETSKFNFMVWLKCIIDLLLELCYFHTRVCQQNSI